MLAKFELIVRPLGELIEQLKSLILFVIYSSLESIYNIFEGDPTD